MRYLKIIFCLLALGFSYSFSNTKNQGRSQFVKIFAIQEAVVKRVINVNLSWEKLLLSSLQEDCYRTRRKCRD